MVVERRTSQSLITDWNDFLLKAKLFFEENWFRKEQTKASIDDYENIKTIGTGTFGRVYLSKVKKGGHYCAIKVLDKQMVIKMKQLEHTLYEKRILQSTKFPFIIHLLQFFKDNCNLYFVLPYIPGGEMFTHLRKSGKFPEAKSAFYSSQIVLALEYMHSLDIAYRDLKPENILLDSSGYLKLADLGFCKVVKGRTYTLCGTPEYIAPEIVLSKGYGLSVDWWALGILLYEMCSGTPPFYHTDPMKIYELIVIGKYKMIPSFSADLKSLLNNLIQSDVSKRYGNMKSGVLDIKSHRWFKHIDWIDILNKKVQPPFVPRIKNEEDTTNFETYDEEPLRTCSKERYREEFEDF